MVMPILLLLFTIVPALEFYLLFKVGGSIGALNTFSLIILTGIVGASLARSQGLSILMKIQNELQTGALPGKAIIHGLLVFGGGLLLLTPGFLTDVLGFSMVIPGTRHIIVEFVRGYFNRGLKNGNIVFMNLNQSGYQYQEQNQSFDQEFRQERFQDNNTFEAEFKKKD